MGRICNQWARQINATRSDASAEDAAFSYLVEKVQETASSTDTAIRVRHKAAALASKVHPDRRASVADGLEHVLRGTLYTRDHRLLREVRHLRLSPTAAEVRHHARDYLDACFVRTGDMNRGHCCVAQHAALLTVAVNNPACNEPIRQAAAEVCVRYAVAEAAGSQCPPGVVAQQAPCALKSEKT